MIWEQPDCWCRVEADLFHLSQGEEQGTVPALDAKELLYQIDQYTVYTT